MPLLLADNDGRIKQVMFSPVDEEGRARLRQYFPYVVFADFDPMPILDTIYIDGGEIRERPDMPAVLDGRTIKNVPPSCHVYITSGGVSVWHGEVDGGEVEISGPPGRYNIDLRCWPYKDLTLECEITP